MAAPPSSRLQNMLQVAVQSVKWTYSLYWQYCPQQGSLIWGDGYYNGPIKTRKTVQPMEVSAEEASLQRSQQLRELYDSLSAGETNQPARRPCAALSPEDLTETEWFYLMCVSFSFPSGVGLPGKAYSKRQHAWLTGANEVDSKTFSRAILAKSARIQTVLCIPLLDGVVEFGTTDKIQEDISMVSHVKGFFVDHPPTAPKPALSEHSTSNPATSSDHPRFHSPPAPPIYAAVDPAPNPNQVEEEEEEDEEEEEVESDSEAETGRNSRQLVAQNPQGVGGAVAEPSELIEMSEDIRLGSPDDASNNLDSDFHMLTVNQAGHAHDDDDDAAAAAAADAEHQRRVDAFRAESTRRWQMMQDPLLRTSLAAQTPPSAGPSQLDDLAHEDTHYSQTVSTILQGQPSRWAETSSTSYISYSSQSAFTKWSIRAENLLHVPSESTSQWLLKYVLFTVPFLHNKYRDENSPKSRDGDAASRFRKGTPQDELSANHVLAERRRREKLNERFIILRSLVPFVTKMDKASILGDTIEYVKQLRKKIQDLEARNRQMEADQKLRSQGDHLQRSTSMKDLRSGSMTTLDRTRAAAPSVTDKRKMRIIETGTGGAKPKAVESPPQPTPTETSVQVSIIESDGLIELQCPHREGLLLDVMQMLRDLRIEITAVQSSLNNGFFIAELRAKVKENVNGKKASIVEVKRAIQQLIPYTDV